MLRWVIALLVLANVGYFAWTQGHLAPLGLAPVEQSEPERLQAQIKPGSLRLINSPKGNAPAEPPPPPPAEPTPATAEPSPAPDTQPEASPTAAASGAGNTANTASTASAATAADAAIPTPQATAAAARTACWRASGFTPAQADALRAALAATGLPSAGWQLSEAKTGGRWVVYMGRYNDEQLDRKKTELTQLGVSFRTLPPPLGPGLALGTYSSEAAAEQGLQDVSRKGVRTARVVAERAEASAWTLRLPALTEAQRQRVTGLGSELAGKRLQPCE